VGLRAFFGDFPNLFAHVETIVEILPWLFL
jgi:hypothetical protein